MLGGVVRAGTDLLPRNRIRSQNRPKFSRLVRIPACRVVIHAAPLDLYPRHAPLYGSMVTRLRTPRARHRASRLGSSFVGVDDRQYRSAARLSWPDRHSPGGPAITSRAVRKLPPASGPNTETRDRTTLPLIPPLVQSSPHRTAPTYAKSASQPPSRQGQG